MMRVDITEALGSDAAAADIRRTVRYALDTRGTAVRLVYVPHELLISACKVVSGASGGAPFIPTILGIPCQFSPHSDVSVACVADDGTNFERTPVRETEVRH